MTEPMRDRIAEELKTALKAGDKPRVSTLRMAQSAIKDRDIANRGAGKDAAGEKDKEKRKEKLKIKKELQDKARGIVEQAALEQSGARRVEDAAKSQ